MVIYYNFRQTFVPYSQFHSSQHNSFHGAHTSSALGDVDRMVLIKYTQPDLYK